MLAKVNKIAEFKLVSVGYHRSEPTYSTEVIMFEYAGKVYAGRKGIDKQTMPLGRFYNSTAEGMYLVRHIRGRYRIQQLDGAVVRHGYQRGTRTGMSGHSFWTKIRFKDGKEEEFCDL